MIKLFTHTDLDGIGSAVICKALKNYVPEFDDVDISYCDPNTINDEMKKFITNDEYKKYTNIFITDLSVNDEIAKKIDFININSPQHHFELMDHHKTAIYLNKYTWATVLCEAGSSCKHFNTTTIPCGTSLFYAYIMSKYNNSIPGTLNMKLKEFTELVRLYDTWEWTTMKNSLISNYSNNMNTLFKLYGRDKFVDSIVKRIFTTGMAVRWAWWFDEVDNKLLELEHIRNAEYVKSVVDNKIHFGNDSNKNNFGIVFAERCTNEIGTYVFDNYKGIDYVAVVDIARKTVGLRTRSTKVDVSEIAKRNGGGGHPQSAGFVINDEGANLFIRTISNLLK